MANLRLPAALKRRATKIHIALFDVDGVLTDGRLYYSDQGVEMKAFSVKDGAGLKLLRDAGLKTGIVTARKSPLVDTRAKELGLHYVFQGVHDKRAVVERLLQELNTPWEALAYMGDDWVDVPVLRRAGLAFSVPDGAALAKKQAHYVTQTAAGQGAVREACEVLLAAQGKLDSFLDAYLA